jgi:hypothetical protein
MSRKTPQFREKIFWQQQNILVWAVKPGQNAPRKENVLKSATKPGQTAAPKRKCPGKPHNSRTNHRSRKKNVPKNEKGVTKM